MFSKKGFRASFKYYLARVSGPHVPALISAGTNETCMDAPPISSTPIVLSCLTNKIDKRGEANKMISTQL